MKTITYINNGKKAFWQGSVKGLYHYKPFAQLIKVEQLRVLK